MWVDSYFIQIISKSLIHNYHIQWYFPTVLKLVLGTMEFRSVVKSTQKVILE